MDVCQFEHTESEREKLLTEALQAAARVASWLRLEHGAVPPSGMWPSWADPFDGAREVVS
jgi:hypothetical protein